MADLIAVVGGFGFFVFAAWFVRLCESQVGQINSGAP